VESYMPLCGAEASDSLGMGFCFCAGGELV